MGPRRCLPPLELLRGTRPMKAARSRPDLNALGSVMVAASAVAPMTPMGAVHMQVSTIGLDLAKNVFQAHGVSAEGKVVLKKQLRRGQVLSTFAKLPPA